MRCPACNSPHVKSAKLIWESSVRIGRYETVSEFAVQFAPPQRRQWFDSNDSILLFGLVLAWYLYILGLGLRFGRLDGDFTYLIEDPYFLPVTWNVIGAVVLLRLIRIIRSIHYNQGQFLVDQERWTRTWGCMRCGEAFVIDEADNRPAGRR